MHALKQKQLGAFFRAALIIVLLLSSGCGVFFHATSQQRPFTPSNTNGDLVMVRTGDQQYYYIVDKKRGVCFFHAKMYGRTHLVNLPCEDIPEYGDIMGMTAANTQAHPPKQLLSHANHQRRRRSPANPKRSVQHHRLPRPLKSAPVK